MPFVGRVLLAPMEGVTDPAFRDVVLPLHPPAQLGGAFTEFLRVLESAPGPAVIRRHLGPHRHPQPVGLQLMGNDAASLAETARRAFEVGVPLVDLNFGCPAKGALRGCAGSALLDEPARVEALLTQVTHAAAPGLVTAKIRAGGEDASRVEELARAVEAGGAAMLTVHARTRAERYCEGRFWERIARAVQAVSIPVCGNGSLFAHEELAQMAQQTGAAFVMAARGAMRDPWIFSGEQVTAERAVGFFWDYASALRGQASFGQRGTLARWKQLVRTWDAGQLFRSDEERLAFLRCASLREALTQLCRRVGWSEEAAWERFAAIPDPSEPACGSPQW